ncbi:MAG: Gfo/Idh/MocA family protein [Promethearchaeota archaeon]|jgi:predicted dehydrogenase
MKLKVGLIGAGGFGYLHLSGYERNENCEITAIASRTEKSAKKAAGKFNVQQVYSGDGWIKMLKHENLDAVSICSPNYLHAQMVIEALKQNCNVLCEKPIAISQKELHDMEQELRRRDLIFFSSFQKRYISFISQIKEMIENQVLGEINLVRHIFSHYGPYTSWRPLSEQKWFFDAEKAGGGVLMDLGVHSIDILRYLIGEYNKVEGYSYNTICKKISNEDNCNVIFRFNNGVLGTMTISWCNEPSDIIEIFGTKGMIKIDMHSKEPLSFRPRKLGRNPAIKEFLQREHSMKIMPQHRLINHFIDCILKGKQESPDFNDGKRAVEFVLEAYSKSHLS